MTSLPKFDRINSPTFSIHISMRLCMVYNENYPPKQLSITVLQSAGNQLVIELHQHQSEHLPKSMIT